MPRIGCDILRLLLLAEALGAVLGLAQSASTRPVAAAILRSVKVISDAQGTALEIVTSSGEGLNPPIETLENPPRLLIDLADTRLLSSRKVTVADSTQVKRVRVNQFSQSPPVTRVVVDLLHPVGYSTESTTRGLLVRLHPVSEARQASPDPPSITALTQGTQPVAVPVSSGGQGIALEAGSRLAGDSSVTAGLEATILRLTRGGEVRVCPGTTLSVTTSQNGRDLMLGMSTGAMEAHYTLEGAADSVLTPDFRMLLAGPGEIHYAVSANSRGDTCVRALAGNAVSVMVSELLGDGTYQVKPNQQVVFRSGHVNRIDSNVPGDCGCPAPEIPSMRASAATAATVSEKDLPPALHLSRPEDQVHAGPPLKSESGAAQASFNTLPAQVALTIVPPDGKARTAMHVQVDAPFVFRAADAAPAAPNVGTAALPMGRRSNDLAPLLVTADPPQPQRRGILGKMKHFFEGWFRQTP